MNLPRSAGSAFKAGLIGLLLIVCLGSEYLHRAALPWPFLNQAQAEVFATFQAADVQWLIVICISVYFIGFIWLIRSLNPARQPWHDEADPGTPPVAQASPPASSGRVSRPVSEPRGADAPLTRSRGRLRYACEAVPGWSRRDASVVLALGLYAIAALAYAMRYDQASKSTDALLLCFGLTLFFGFRFWRVVEAKRSRPFNIAGVVVAFTLILLSVATVWRPESLRSFQYRGQARWSGLWDNPNTFGMLMGVGVVLAVGQVIKRLTAKGQSSKAVGEHPTSNIQHPTPNSGIWRWVTIVLFLCAAGVCSVGLLRSYSRGAWVGAAVGGIYLVYQVIRCQESGREADAGRAMLDAGREMGKSESRNREAEISVGSRGSRLIPWLCRNWVTLAVVLLSVVTLTFWNFRHTERLVARRAFSVGNVNDFSWRNRVAAYEGSLQMMASRPLLGFGWNQPESVYDQFFRAPKVDEGAAIQLNDYFTLGTALGIPALLCFVSFIGLALTRNSELGTRNDQTAPPVTRHFSPHAICRAGALVLLIGFWFEGGLFKLATGATFWILLELGGGD